MAEDNENPFNIPESLTSGNINQTLVDSAYIGKKIEQNTRGKLIQNLAFQGLNTFTREYNANKALEEAQHEEAMIDINANADEIYATAGSLPQTYFDQSWTYVEGLREQYAEAVKNDDTKAQHQLKAQLNQYVTYIGGLKDSLNANAESLKSGDMLGVGELTHKQIQIQRSCVNKNAVLVDGEFKYKAIDKTGQPIIKNGEQVYYTLEDLNNTFVTKDYASQEIYLDGLNTIVDNGDKFRLGESEDDFDESVQYRQNEKSITEDNIQYMMRGDFFNDRTFEEAFSDHPDFQQLFSTLGSTDYGTPNVKMIELYDKNGDKKIGYSDFMEYFKGLGMVDPTGGAWTDDDIERLMTSNPDLKGKIEAIIAREITVSITRPTHKNYDFNTSKRFLAEFMTLRDEKLFYGDDFEKAKLLVPGVPGATITKNELQKMYYQEYIDKGGNVGYLKSQNWYIDKRGYPDRPEKWRWKQKTGIETFKGGMYNVVS